MSLSRTIRVATIPHNISAFTDIVVRVHEERQLAAFGDTCFLETGDPDCPLPIVNPLVGETVLGR
jgi:hypothetical protein